MFLSLTEVVIKLKEAIDPTTIFSVCVTREDMFSRGMTQWKRQKKSSPKNPLRVTFIGEPGIDSGALMKEFLTGLFLFSLDTVVPLNSLWIVMKSSPHFFN